MCVPTMPAIFYATKLVFVVLLTAMTFLLSQQQQQDDLRSIEQFDGGKCPTWMYRKNESDTSSPCICGTDDGYNIICNATTKEVYIIDGMVMTYDETTQQLVAGQTLYGWTQKSLRIKKKTVYRRVPTKRSKVNEYMCGRFDRTGQLCGECVKNHTPKIYSYEYNCRRCYRQDRAWVLFICATAVPITAFYILVVIFKFNSNSPGLHAYILAAQIIYSPQIIRHYTVQYSKHMHAITNTIITLYGIWNLDYIGAFDTKFCLNFTKIQTLALGYLTPFYTLLLITGTCAIIELHSRGCRVTTWITRLFQKRFKFLRKEQEYKPSIISVFSTFLLLSYNKVLSTHTDLLVYTQPFNKKGERFGKYLYYDPTSRYFHGTHLLYGILAISIAIIFTLIPMIVLFLYPTKCFRKSLHFLRIDWHGLHIFFDTFTGCYKDGTEPGTRDCRYFAALFLLLRVSTYLTLSLTSIMTAIAVNAMTIILFTTLFSIRQPYRAKFAIYNKITVLILASMAALYIALLGIRLSTVTITNYDIHLSLWIVTVLVLMPQVYIAGVVLRWVCKIVCKANAETTPLLHHGMD